MALTGPGLSGERWEVQYESQSRPGTKMVVIPEPCTGLRRRPKLSMVGIVPYLPSSTQVLIVAHMSFRALNRICLLLLAL